MVLNYIQKQKNDDALVLSKSSELSQSSEHDTNQHKDVTILKHESMEQSKK